MLTHRIGAAALIASALILIGCGGGTSNSTQNPRFQPQVANVADNFQFQSTGVTNVTETLNYTWQNSGIRAVTDQSCAISAGTAFINLYDANGARVYSADLKANGSFSSIAGTAGAWRIEVVLTGVSGTINFRVQKSP